MYKKICLTLISVGISLVVANGGVEAQQVKPAPSPQVGAPQIRGPQMAVPEPQAGMPAAVVPAPKLLPEARPVLRPVPRPAAPQTY